MNEITDAEFEADFALVMGPQISADGVKFSSSAANFKPKEKSTKVETVSQDPRGKSDPEGDLLDGKTYEF